VGEDSAVDLVLRIDLTESMAAEVDAARGALREMLPELLSARPGWRCGWIGYRDEVVDRCPLTDEAPLLLASFDRWRCEAGGDVPEGLDEALFEAFRVGALPWRAGAQHRFIVLGDSPPPYDRIAEMVELARSAHGAPERFTVDCLGILREEEWEEVPGFRDLAEATAGSCRFVPEGSEIAGHWWSLLAGDSAPRWEDH
jgi:hypothetical protein